MPHALPACPNATDQSIFDRRLNPRRRTSTIVVEARISFRALRATSKKHSGWLGFAAKRFFRFRMPATVVED